MPKSKDSSPATVPERRPKTTAHGGPRRWQKKSRNTQGSRSPHSVDPRNRTSVSGGRARRLPPTRRRESRCAPGDGRPRHEPINSEALTTVRFGAHCGLTSDTAPCPKSAKNGSLVRLDCMLSSKAHNVAFSTQQVAHPFLQVPNRRRMGIAPTMNNTSKIARYFPVYVH